jgi:hypothetical protein
MGTGSTTTVSAARCGGVPASPGTGAAPRSVHSCLASTAGRGSPLTFGFVLPQALIRLLWSCLGDVWKAMCI